MIGGGGWHGGIRGLDLSLPPSLAWLLPLPCSDTGDNVGSFAIIAGGWHGGINGLDQIPATSTFPGFAAPPPCNDTGDNIGVLTVKVCHFGQHHASGGGSEPLVQLEGASTDLDGVHMVGMVGPLDLGVRVGQGRVLPRCQGCRC